jgi:hypothetical protein
MRHPIKWILIIMVLVYVIKQPDQAATMAGHLGSKLGQWSTSMGNSLGTFATRLGS